MPKKRPAHTSTAGSADVRSDARVDRFNLFLEKLALILGGGVLLALPFLVPRLAPLHFVALVPWTVLFLQPRYQANSAWVLIGSFIYLFVSLRPYVAFHILVPLGLSLLNFYAYIAFPVALKRLAKFHVPLAIAVPVAWVAADWLRVFLSARQLQMYFLGSSQFQWTKLIQIADLGGIYAVTFVVATVSGAIAEFLIPSDRTRRTISVAATIAIFACSLGYGYFRDDTKTLRRGSKVAVLQPNAIHYKRREKNTELLSNQSELTRRSIVPGSVDLIVWPENAIEDDLNLRKDYQWQLGELATDMHSAVLLGAYTAIPGKRWHTSTYLFGPDGALLRRYDKVHMIFWSEYMPLENELARFPLLRRWHYSLAKTALGWAGAGARGTEVTVFEAPAREGVMRFSTPICFETTDMRLWSEAAHKGADFLVNLTSEGVLGTPTYTHLLALTAFRAVENRMGAIRAANNGMSAFVDSNGHIRSVLQGESDAPRFGEHGVLVDRVIIDMRRGTTVYSNYGDVFAVACLIVAALTVLLDLVYRRAPRSAPLGLNRLEERGR